MASPRPDRSMIELNTSFTKADVFMRKAHGEHVDGSGQCYQKRAPPRWIPVAMLSVPCARLCACVCVFVCLCCKGHLCHVLDFVFVCSSVCVWLGQIVAFGGNICLSQTALILANFDPLPEVWILISLILSYVHKYAKGKARFQRSPSPPP